jgi:hypothetical protein
MYKTTGTMDDGKKDIVSRNKSQCMYSTMIHNIGTTYVFHNNMALQDLECA